MDPIIILKNIATIASAIGITVSKVKINKAQCQRLAFRVSLITTALFSFQITLLEIPSANKLFSDILKCLNWCLEFVLEFEHAPFISKLFNFKKHGKKFSELNALLNTYVVDLNLIVNILNLQDAFNSNDDQNDHDSDLKNVQELIQKGFENMTSLLQEKFDIITRKIDAIIDNNEISDTNSLASKQERTRVQMRDIEVQINNILNLMAQFDASTSEWWKNTGKFVEKFVREKLRRLREYSNSQRHISTMLELKEWIREQKNYPDKVLGLKDDIKEIIDCIRHRSSLIIKSIETEFRLLPTQTTRATKRKASDDDVKVQNSESVAAPKRRSTSSMDAEPTDPEEQFKLGVKCSNGEGIEKNETKALYWYQKAADQGHIIAQFNLGVVYTDGLGLEEDEAKAVYWYQKAADQGDRDGQFNLGVMYAAGEGIEKNETKAVYWYQKAADQGDVAAQFALGVMYDNGRGIEKDEAKAVYWYQKAADQGSADGQFNLAVSYTSGQGIRKNETEAAYWYRKAADQGDAMAQSSLGISYARGLGIKQDQALAVYWYQKAADQGNAIAQFNLGVSYTNSRGIEKDDTKAAYWYRKAADQGYATAQASLGFSYANGRGIGKDDTKAAYWYRKAAREGNVIAQFNLGTMYDEGRGVEKDEVKAAYWFRKATDQGNTTD